MKNRADFYAVYIKEAHPSDGWKSGGNERAGIRVKQASQFDERVEAAESCCGALDLGIPMIVDGIDNRVGEAYSGFPDRLFVIDGDGKVAFKSGRGPFGFIPAEMEQDLLLMLMDDNASERKHDEAQSPDPRTASNSDSHGETAISSDANEGEDRDGDRGAELESRGGVTDAAAPRAEESESESEPESEPEPQSVE